MHNLSPGRAWQIPAGSTGRRVYRNKTEIPQVLGGLGLAIVSTSKGVLSGSDAVRNGVGGEVLCQIW